MNLGKLSKIWMELSFQYQKYSGAKLELKGQYLL